MDMKERSNHYMGKRGVDVWCSPLAEWGKRRVVISRNY